MWYGRFPGATAFGCAGSSENPRPRFCSVKAASLRHDAGAEPVVVAVDEAAGVPLLVDHGEINRVRCRTRRARNRVDRRARRVDERAPSGGVGGIEQRLDRHVGEGRIGDIASGVSEGKPHRLDQQMERLGRARFPTLQRESCGDLKRHQRRQTLPGRGTLVDPVIPVAGADRRLEGRAVRGEVAGRQHAAELVHDCANRLGDATGVEALGSASGYGSEGSRESRIAPDLPGPGGGGPRAASRPRAAPA